MGTLRPWAESPEHSTILSMHSPLVTNVASRQVCAVPRFVSPAVILLALLHFWFSAGALRGDVVLAPLFQDHAVLQRDKPVPVWGRAAPGEEVAVTFAGQTVRATADRAGRWRVALSPLKVSSVPAEMIVRGRNEVIVRDLLVGEVWLCSGQSNMAWSVGASANPDAEIAAANWPLIRQIKIAFQVAHTPQPTAEGTWQVCSPGTVATFTAVGYYFVRDLHRELRVPIGLVNSSVGGSSIEAWLSQEALQGDPAFAVVGDRWKKVVATADPAKLAAHEVALTQWKAAVAQAASAHDGSVAPVRPLAPPGPDHFSAPSGLYNAMLYPLLPYALRGAIWYQGESNAGRSGEYARLFPALIGSWRREFGQGDIPFYWVQLPNYNPKDATGETWALLREAQAQALTLPATGQAITIDIGNPDSGHPYNKQDVGSRLALIAKAKTYGLPVDFAGPRFTRVERQGSGLLLHFADAERGLEARGPLLGFEVAGPDRWFLPARASIHGTTVLVSAPQVPEPVYVRYAWSNSPPASLFEQGGLPAGPFRAGVSGP